MPTTSGSSPSARRRRRRRSSSNSNNPAFPTGELVSSRPRARQLTDLDLSGPLPSALPGFLAALPLLHPRAAQRSRHRLVPLVAGVFVDLILAAPQEQRRAPRL